MPEPRGELHVAGKYPEKKRNRSDDWVAENAAASDEQKLDIACTGVRDLFSNDMNEGSKRTDSSTLK